MRKVSLNKYKYSYKDIFRWLSIFFLHFFGFYTYIMIILAFHLILGGSFFPEITTMNWGILYPMSLGPVFSSLLHIIYVERGFTNVKAMLWLHALACAILVPVVVFAL